MKKRARGTRTGFTTGANAAAAARAATIGLVAGKVPAAVEAVLPNGKKVRFPVHEGWVRAGSAHAVCIKDAGDDPDCTDGAHLTAEVALLDEAPGEVRIEGGAGVGRITMPGLGLPVGGAAINPTPRRNIEENVRAAAGGLLERWGLRVVISVPGGEEMAKKTLNDRLGIVGGISILGTTGIVHPYSTAAFRASVVQGIEVAARQGRDTVALTTGGRTEKALMRALPELPQVCFVQMGDFLAPAMDAAVGCGIRQTVIGGMVGKLTKIAQGERITHARRQAVDTALLAEIARKIGAPEGVCAAIEAAETARFAAEALTEIGLAEAFHRALADRVVQRLNHDWPTLSHRVLVFDFSGGLLADTKGEP